jgi:uncharacterized membrane protein
MQKQQIKELVENNIITPKVAEDITNYFNNKRPTASKLPIVFGIFGALLGGLGIILLIGHNWDDFSVTTKSILAFVPLIIGQLISGYTLLKKFDSIAWRESSGAFLFCGVGAAIALIAQIYHIPGNFNGFMLTWMLLCLPLVYLLKSSAVSLLYLIGITVYNINLGYIDYKSEENYWYWLLLLGIVPFYFNLIKKQPLGNFTVFHHWFIGLTLLINIGTLNDNNDGELIFITYGFFAALLYLIGKTKSFQNLKIISNSYLIIGKLAGLYILYMASFRFVWKELVFKNIEPNLILISVTIAIFITCGILFYNAFKKRKHEAVTLFHYNFLVMALLFLVAQISIIATVMIANLYMLFLGLQEIQKGNKTNSLARLNFGILIITVLTGCRFFDENMTFIVRGVMFIIVGFGFFALNYFLLKKRKQNEN